MNGPAFEQMINVDAGHPVFAGHFPGDPLVPAVILLEQVAIAVREWRGLRMARVLEAKFMAPLLPAHIAMLRLTEATPNPDARIRFEIRRDDNLLARGIVEVAA
jgi:3-hydroxymyristoyl/3-hydroxydecanoyl-(acyl carrier protein) dehydratase